MSSQTKEKAEQFLKASHDVIATDHTIAIRYHRFQDDHRDEPLAIGSHCYIVLNDKRHCPYLVSAIILKIDNKNEKYEIQRINDNETESYHFNQIVVAYDKNIHSINIEKHKQYIESLRNNNNNTVKRNKKITKKQNKRKRKRDTNESESIQNNNQSNNNSNDNDSNENDNRPNKKRKLNDANATNINTKINNNNKIINNKKNKPNVLSIAQPYFPIPHPYFRQNAILKWRSSDNNDTEYEVGRIIDFDMDNDIIYIQNTYRCGTKDDEQADVIQTNWNQFKQQTNAQFIDHSYLYQLKQPVLYWWDRPGCGCVCEDTIESLDYGSYDDLLYGITGGQSGKNKLKKWKDHQLKWVHKDGLFKPTCANKLIMGKYISRTHRGAYKKQQNIQTLLSNNKNKIYDIIIIGAGMAGLTVNWALNKINKKYKIKILEAQNYLGGRLKTHIFPKKIVYHPNNKNIYSLPKVSVELGAAFLSGSAKDNRFWGWLQKNKKHICADWGGYNNGWWNGQSFIDSELGEFVSDIIIERIKNICDDIQILCCKLLMPLDDMSVIDGLEYLKHKIPQQQLFSAGISGNNELERNKIEKYFYYVYDKYKILAANWVGPQGLWQQQQTIELQNLDFEALYKFLNTIFGNNKKSKKWLRATEKLIMDYYGDKTNIKTHNFDVFAEKRQYNYDDLSYDIENDDKIITMNGNNNNNDNDLYNPNQEDDSEATESETHSETLSPLIHTKSKSCITNNINSIERGDFKLSDDLNWDDIVKYDVSDYDGVEYQYKFGFRDVLVRDIIHPPHEEEATEFEKTTELSNIDYQRFRDALEHLADCNLFSYHLYFLRCNQKWNKNIKVQKLLNRFKEDLSLFDSAIEDFKKILGGKKNVVDEYQKPQAYHTNRKTSKFDTSPRNNNKINKNINVNKNMKNNANHVMRVIISDIINGIDIKNHMVDDKKENGNVVVKDEQMDLNGVNNNVEDNKNNFEGMLPKLDSNTNHNNTVPAAPVKQEINNEILMKENNNKNNEDTMMDVDENENNNKVERKKRRHKKHKKDKKDKKKHNKKKGKKKKHDYIDIAVEEEFKQDKFDKYLSLDSNAEILGDGFVTGGYSQVLEPFMKDINNSHNINMNHQVTSVEKINGGKYAEHLNEIRGIDLITGKPFTFYSNFVAVSVPLGILKLSLNELNKGDCNNNSGIKFKPQLSIEKREAINAMGMGCENKVYLRFTTCFWPRDKPYFQSIQHPEYRFINLSYKRFKLPANTNVLCTMIPPTMGKKWHSCNPAQELRVVWDVLRVLNQMFKVRNNNNNENKIKINKDSNGEVMMNGHGKNGYNNDINVGNNVKDNDINVGVNDINNNVNDVMMNDNNIEKKNENNINKNENELKIEEKDNNNNNNNNKMEEDIVMHQYNNDKMEEDIICNNENENENENENILYDSCNIQRECKLLNNTLEIGELLEMLVDYKVTDWEHNIFTRGSYSYLPKGAIYTHCKSLQKYDGNGIYFCGEATSIEGFECVDGAHETGFNVAKEIHKQLEKNKLKYKQNC